MVVVMKNILYIFMRNDLPSMNVGKAMAQASHASAQLVTNYSSKYEDIKNWAKEGKGFGTTIVLEGSKNSISHLLLNVINKRYSIITGNIIDEKYPFKAQKEIFDLLNFKDNEYNIQIVDDTMDKFGMILCTRKEHTCSWMFFCGNEDEQEHFKKLCEAFNISLHK